METYSLAIISPKLGLRSETFIHRHMTELLPGQTVVVARSAVPDLHDIDIKFPYLLLGKPKWNLQWLYRGSLYYCKLKKLSPVQTRVEQYLREHDVKIILSQYLNHSLKWLEVARKMGIRFFAHAHGYDISITLRDPDMCRRYQQLEAADGIITMSEYSRNKLINLGLSAEKIHVIPYGINVADAPLSKQSDDIINCLAVGRMVAKKAPTLTLEAFRRALMSNSRLHLDYVGDGDLFDEAAEFVQANALSGHVTLHGSQPHRVVLRLMKKADIFLQHSRTDSVTGDEEGLPVSILEAMAHSLPVISTRHTGIPEAVIDGHTGFLVDEGDTKGMAAYILKLTKSAELRVKTGHEGWRRAKKKYSWQNEKASLLNLIGLDSTESPH